MKTNKPSTLVKCPFKRHIESKSLFNGFSFNPHLSQKKSPQLNLCADITSKTSTSPKQSISLTANCQRDPVHLTLRHKKYLSLFSAEPVFSLERPFHSSRITKVTPKQRQKKVATSTRTFRPSSQDEAVTRRYRSVNIPKEKSLSTTHYLEANDYKHMLNDQHNIIEMLHETVNQSTKHTEALKQENDTLRKKVKKSTLLAKKIHLKNQRLELCNNHLFQRKKCAEQAIMKEDTYKRAISQLKQRLKEYKCTQFKQQTQRASRNKSSEASNELRPFNYEEIKHIEPKPIAMEDTVLGDKVLLLQNIIKELNKKITVYERYLSSMNIDPEGLLVKKKNSQNYHDLSIVNNWLETTESNIFKETEEETTRKSRSMSVYEAEFFELLYILLKSLEGKGVTHPFLSEKLTEVYHRLSTVGSIESTREQFADCFAQVLIDLIETTKEKDKLLIKQFFYALVESSKDDTSVFFTKMIDLFDNLHDYSQVDNISSYKESIRIALKPYKDVIIKACSSKKSAKSFVIEFKKFQMIIRDNKIVLDEDAMEFMIYYMKKTLQSSFGLYELNMLPLIQLLTNSEQTRHSVIISDFPQRHKPSLIPHKSIA